jgi:hypothetical protein
MISPFWWGVVLGVVGTWVFHAVMPSTRAVGQPGG